MQNAVADQRVQADTLGATTTISLRDTVSGSTGQVRSGIEVIPENPSSSGPIKDLHAVFCRDLLEFLGDFRSAAPKSSSVRRLGQAAVAQGPPATRDPAPHQDILFDFLRAFEAAPKMRPLSHMGVGRVAPGTAGTSAGSIDVPAIEPQAGTLRSGSRPTSRPCRRTRRATKPFSTSMKCGSNRSPPRRL